MHLNPLLDVRLLRETLVMALDQTPPACSAFQWRLVGTGAALLRGVDLPAGDIDVLVKEREAVDAWAAALASFECLLAPVWLEHDHQYYAEYRVNGVEVGISTVETGYHFQARETVGIAPWRYYDLLPCGAHFVPTVALELRLATELVRQRPDRYEPIVAFMREEGFGRELLDRAIKEAELPEIVQERTWQSLQLPSGQTC